MGIVYLAVLTDGRVPVRCLDCLAKHIQRECLSAYIADLCGKIGNIFFARFVCFVTMQSLNKITAFPVVPLA